ncbi:unnamed protein product [Caenorhabditis auriculariae]|uniref:Rabphilin-3A n=2 Tax=Caenorhabditis TaxID=6237 RepID=A0A8S1H4R5_9PELO|nr:unnamed protein product [Caenorhabditis auriculariae]
MPRSSNRKTFASIDGTVSSRATSPAYAPPVTSFTSDNLANNNSDPIFGPTAARPPSLPQLPPKRQVPPRMGLLRHLSGFLDSKRDLMNDWEIGGTQNKWVCPSDRHLQLRAQLKSGWSVRTATARSPTNSKGTNGTITEAEQEHIRQVLAKAEESRNKEQQRIGKMVDRLEKMRRRATGNGVTHCLLCHTEFGLLAAKSYAAMCVDCRKYVCQRNCGVETLDPQRGEVVFLCKICSEAREVLWKKSGAWFYKEMPDFVRPELGNGALMSPPSTSTAMTMPTASSRQPQWAMNSATTASALGPSGLPFSNGVGASNRRLPTAPNDPRLRKSTSRGSIVATLCVDSAGDRPRSPRPRIQPSWVKEKVMSSMSVDDEDRSSSDGDGFVQSGVIRKHHHHKNSSRREANLARFALHSARISDSEDDSSPESRGSTRSTTSPRRSLATPSSYDAAPTHDVTHDDARSIDSGVVQSDHSNQQANALTLSSSSLTPFTHGSLGGDNGGLTGSPRRISHPDSGLPRVTQSSSGTSLVTPPPLPPRTNSDHRTSSPAHSTEHKMSNASSIASSAGGPRRVTPLSDAYNCEPIRPVASAIRCDSPPVSFMSSPDDDSKLRNRRREGVARIDSLPLRARTFSQEEAPLSTAASTSQLKSQSTLTATSSKDEESKTENDVEEAEDVPPANQHGGGRGSSASSDASRRARRGGVRGLFACFFSSSSRRTLGSIQFNITYNQDDKKLVVHLVRAKNLKAMDSNGFSDPYVKLHLLPGNNKATKLTSKTIEKTLNPEWNEELVYHGVTEEDKQKKTLRVTVLDRDRIGSDFLGETRIALRKLPVNQVKKFNLYLEHAIPVPQQKKEEEETLRGKINVSLQYNIQQGSLFVNVNRCVELIGMDSTGFSDPYCKVSLTPVTSKAHRQRTSIKKRTLNPEFNETMQFVVPFKDLPKKTLQIGVYDHDLGRHDDYIGGILLSTSAKDERGKQWITCIENPGTLVEAWHKLELDS